MKSLTLAATVTLHAAAIGAIYLSPSVPGASPAAPLTINVAITGTRTTSEQRKQDGLITHVALSERSIHVSDTDGRNGHRSTESGAPSSSPATATSSTSNSEPPNEPRRVPPTDSGNGHTSASLANYEASNRKPVYPLLSRRQNEQGTVLLQVLVKADGTAGEVHVKKTSGHSLLDESALAAVREWRFRPAARNGQPIAEWYQIAIPYTLHN